MLTQEEKKILESVIKPLNNEQLKNMYSEVELLRMHPRVIEKYTKLRKQQTQYK